MITVSPGRRMSAVMRRVPPGVRYPAPDTPGAGGRRFRARGAAAARILSPLSPPTVPLSLKPSDEQARTRSAAGMTKGMEDRFVTTDLDTLLAALYVKIDDWLGHPPRVGRPPGRTDAEPLTLAIAQTLLGIRSETR
ncbi:hypothetical protein GCM10010517_23380 [Streptosporangium fragile]|uniref:Uncharacterized protein n=1 Tax=Streptosporangium fragile TaxID=46186 RepID=A0ABN3VXM6_9ACTN